MSELEPIAAAELTGISGWPRIDVVERTGSTNVDLAERVRGGDLERAVLIAEFQSAGRGRHARVWTAPPRTQLSISVVLPLPPTDVAGPRSRALGGRALGDRTLGDREVGWVPLLTGLAAVASVAPTGVTAEMKWPNDVMVGDKKLAGILAELVFAPAGDQSRESGAVAGPGPGAAVVIGMGLNVALTAADFPTDRAISILQARGDLESEESAAALDPIAVDRSALDRTALAGRYLRELDRRFEQWLTDPAGLIADYRTVCATIGQRVRIELPDRIEVGTAIDVTAAGNIVVRGEDGVQTAYAAGDVTHLRPLAE